MDKYELLKELLQKFYEEDYSNIKKIINEDKETYRINFDDGIALTVNTGNNIVYVNISYHNADQSAILEDVSDAYDNVEVHRAKKKYKRALEALEEAKAELEQAKATA
jgi:hypothetical protein